ncbi:MAG: hypothetical protein ACE5E6_09555, partial [Phycisphaerae bacterium]
DVGPDDRDDVGPDDRDDVEADAPGGVIGADDAARRARVPWRRYGGGPERTPPAARRDTAEDEGDTGDGSDDDPEPLLAGDDPEPLLADDDPEPLLTDGDPERLLTDDDPEPLLTDEELDALFRDDVSAIAPDDAPRDEEG